MIRHVMNLEAVNTYEGNSPTAMMLWLSSLFTHEELQITIGQCPFYGPTHCLDKCCISLHLEDELGVYPC